MGRHKMAEKKKGRIKMKNLIKILAIILWTIIAMIAGNIWGAAFPLKAMAIAAGAIIMFMLGVAAGIKGCCTSKE